MASSTRTRGTPRAWREILQRHWPRIDAVEVDWRPNNNAPWQGVEGGSVQCPEIIDAASGEARREGPEAAAKLAGEMYGRCHVHLNEQDEKYRILWYQISVSEMKDGVMTVIESTGVGGGINRDGTVESDDTDDRTDAERKKAREDYNFDLYKKSTDINFKLLDKFVSFLTAVEGIVGRSFEAQAKAAGAAAEAAKAEYDFKVDIAQMDEAGKAFEKFMDEMGPAAKIYASAYYASATRSKNPDREKHDNPTVEAARVLLDHLDGPTQAKLSTIIDAEPMHDVLVVLAMALHDEPDINELRAAWLEVFKPFEKASDDIIKALGPEGAQALGAALYAFHSQITAS